MGERAVFLDRDGVLVVPEFRAGRSFAPRSLAEFRLYEGAAASSLRLKEAGFKLVIVTNQPDVGNGLVEKETVEQMNRMLRDALPVDAIEVCYHTANDNCDCRKPKPGMLLRAAQRLNIDCDRSILIGDRWSDIEAAKAAGCMSIFIDLHYQERQPGNPDFIVSSFNDAAELILATQ